VTVSADKKGEIGNTGPVEKLLIPGFSGSPKYQKFYGELKEGATGGTVGETKIPTVEDIALAKAEGVKAVEAKLRNQASSQIPSEFKIVAGATKFTILKQDVKSTVDADGNFVVTTQGQFSILGFREKDILSVLTEKMKAEKGSQYQFENPILNYNVSEKSLDNPLLGKLSLPIDFKALISENFDAVEFKNKIKGKTSDGIKQIINTTPGIKNGSVSLWPFWVKKAPLEESKIKVIVK
jgi:hypothetical protein